MSLFSSQFATSSSGIAYRPLGAFRFVLALLVVAQHFTNFAPTSFQTAVVPLGIGSIAVLAFFAVSGFVIAEAIELYYRGRVGAFLTNRAIRIFPPFFGAVTATVLLLAVLLAFGPVRHPDMTETAVLTPDALTPINILGNYTHVIPGMKLLGLQADVPLIALVWSIRTELLFYLVMAFAMLAPARFYHAGLGLLAVAAFAVFGLNAVTDKGPDSLMFIPFFIFGVAAYYALKGHLAAVLVTILSAAASLLAFVQNGGDLHPTLVAQFGAPNAALRVALLGGLLTAVPLLAMRSAGKWRGLDRALGDLSYPLYLNHVLTMYAVRAFWPQVGWAGLALALVATLLVTYAMYRLIEPGLNALRDRVRGGRTGQTIATGQMLGPRDLPYTVARINRLPV